MKTLLLEILKIADKSIDWISKNLGRIKTIGIILIFTLFVISFISNGCNRDQANKLFQKVTGLDLQNDILSLRNRTLQDSLNKEIAIRLNLMRSKELLEQDKYKLLSDNKTFKKRLADIPAWLLNMPADSSYKFLNEVAYNYPGEKKYPFNDPQVKNIHADYLENASLIGLVATLEDQLVNCERIGENSDSLALSFQKSYKTAEKQRDNLTDVVKNTQEKADLYKAEVNKNKRGKKFWRTTSGVLSVIAIILIL